MADRIAGVFDTHRFVFFGSTHGGVKRHEMLLCLLSRKAFQDRVTDLVVELASGAHQELLDRYVVELEELPPDALRPIAFDTDRPRLFATIPQVPELLRAVRRINEGLELSDRIRLLGGSETVEWWKVRSPEDLAPYPFKTNYSAHLITEHLAPDPEARVLTVFGDGGHILHGGTLTGDVEAKIDPDRLFVILTLRTLGPGERELVAAFGDPDAPFFVGKSELPEVDRLPEELSHLEADELGQKIDALVYLGPSPDRNLMGTIPLSEEELRQLERRRALNTRETMEIRYGGRERWFEDHPHDVPADPREKGDGGV